MHADRFVEIDGALVEYRKYFLWLQAMSNESKPMNTVQQRVTCVCSAMHRYCTQIYWPVHAKAVRKNKFKSSVSNRTRPFEEVICSSGYIVAVAIQLDVSKPKKIAEI